MKNWLTLLTCMTALAAPAPAQEETPNQDPAVQEPGTSDQEPAPEQEPELEMPPLPGQDPAMEDVMEAIENVREAFVRVDRLWTEVRGAADDALLDPETPSDVELSDKLLAGVSEASTLIADIEHLLEILPEADSEQQQQQQQQQQNGGQQQQQQEGDQQQQNRDGENPDGTDDPAMLGNQEALQPATGDVSPDAPPIFLAPGSGGGSWGHLPPRLQQTLQNSHAEDLPLRYRGLLEQFHKRRVRD